MVFERVLRDRRGPMGALKRGSRLLERGDLPGAADAFRVAAQCHDPGVAPLASLRLGLTLRRLGDRDGAEEALRSAADSGHPDHGPMAAFSLGGLYGDDHERATAAYRRAVDSRHAEAAPTAALCLGEIREEQGDLDTAEFLYSRALDSRHPDVAPKAAFNLGELRRRRGEVESAATAFRRAVDSRHPDVVGPALRALDELSGHPTDDSPDTAPDGSPDDPPDAFPSTAAEMTFGFSDQETGVRVAQNPDLLDALLVENGREDLIGGEYRGMPTPDGGYQIVISRPTPDAESEAPSILDLVQRRIDQIQRESEAAGVPPLTPEQEKDAAVLARLGLTALDGELAAVRRIGERHHRDGGVPLMWAVLHRAEVLSLQRNGLSVLGTVEAAWSGIGDWVV